MYNIFDVQCNHNIEKNFFGRRRGKSLSNKQKKIYEKFFPMLAIKIRDKLPISLESLFIKKMKKIHIEIGFGRGENILNNAIRFADIGFIGIEPFIQAMAKFLTYFEEKSFVNNIRIYDDDAINILDILPDKSIDCVDIFYPDPWKKRKHFKRRFINMKNLYKLSRIMKKGSILRFVSDVDDYVNWTLYHINNHPFFSCITKNLEESKIPYLGWRQTHYAKKAIKNNQISRYFSFIRC